MREYLKDRFDYTGEEVEKIINNLQVHNPATLEMKLGDLKKIYGFSNEELKNAILKSSEIVDYSIEQIIQKGELFSRYLFMSNEEYKSLLLREPDFLASSTKNLMLKCFVIRDKICSDPNNIKSIILKCPKILTYSHENLAKKINLCLKNGINKHVLIQKPFLLNMSSNSLITKLAICKYYRIPVAQFIHSGLYMHNETDLYSKLAFLKSKNLQVCEHISHIKSLKFRKLYNVQGSLARQFPFNNKKKKEILKQINLNDEDFKE